MNEPIIIETTTTTRERLVLVPAARFIGFAVMRDATAADMERGGWVREMVEPTGPGTLAHLRADLRDAVKRAEHAEQLTSELQATIARAFSYIERTPGVRYLDTEVKKLGERAEKAELELADAESRAAHMLAVIRERATLRAELAEAIAHHDNVAVVRDVLGAEEGESTYDAALRVSAEVKTLRAELARLTAPGEGSEGEPTDNDLRDVWNPESTMANARRAIYRLGVAHERARHAQPAQGRATDGDLLAIAADAFQHRAHGGPVLDDLHKLAVAVAARVRKERCLVAQAVGMGIHFAVMPQMRAVGSVYRSVAHADSDSETVSLYRAERPISADVPATLARLLGEVSR